MATTKILPGNVNAAVAMERMRISAIMESPEGLLRPKAALQLALRSDMASASAVEFLRTTPADNPYLIAMATEGPVNIGGSMGATAGPTDPKAARLAEIAGSMTNYNATQGYAPKKPKV